MDNEESKDEIPEPLETSFPMESPNQPINIFEGDFTIKFKTIESPVSLNGLIKFDWLPYPNVNFENIEINVEITKLAVEFKEYYSYPIYIDGKEVGNCHITFATFEHFKNNSTVITGKFIDKFIIGDDTKLITSLKFTIPNLRSFDGEHVQKITDDSFYFYKGRLTFEYGDFKITLNKRREYNILEEDLRKNGGYLLLYNGEYKKKNSTPITNLEAKKFLYCFGKYLSFINGRMTSPIFIEGVNDGNVIWTDYSVYKLDYYKQVQTWSIGNNTEVLDDIWKNFSALWTKDSEFLISVIHWYIEANTVNHYIEGNLILAQTALELIYNWFVIEKGLLLFGNDADNISAANKIRLLLSKLNVTGDVPKSFTALQNTLKSKTNDLKDGPGVASYIRNCIVHSKLKNRENLKLITEEVKSQALQLCLWYVELSILKILNYKGKYYNRCLDKPSYGDRIESVP